VDHAAHFKEILEETGFESIHVFDDEKSISSLLSYVVAFVDYDARTYWYQSAAEIELRLHQLTHEMRSNKPALLYFDGPTMVSYQTPPKVYERVYCTDPSHDEECNEYTGFDPSIVNIPLTDIQVRNSSLGEQAGRGLFALKTLPSDSPIGMEGHAQNFFVMPTTWDVIESTVDWVGENGITLAMSEIGGLEAFIDGYGFASRLLGEKSWSIDSGILEFMNHGCNGTANYGYHSSLTEWNADTNTLPEELDTTDSPYNIVFDRHMKQVFDSGDYTLREIAEGDEIFSNYLDYSGEVEFWEEEVMTLRGQCAGEAYGTISQYEMMKKQ